MRSGPALRWTQRSPRVRALKSGKGNWPGRGEREDHGADDDAQLHEELESLEQVSGDRENAAEEYDRAVKANPYDASALGDLEVFVHGSAGTRRLKGCGRRRLSMTRSRSGQRWTWPDFSAQLDTGRGRLPRWRGSWSSILTMGKRRHSRTKSEPTGTVACDGAAWNAALR